MMKTVVDQGPGQSTIARRLEPLITHHFKLDQILEAYETFNHAAVTSALKILFEA